MTEHHISQHGTETHCENEFTLFCQNSLDAMLMLDEQQRILFANPLACRLLQTSLSTLKGTPIRAHIIGLDCQFKLEQTVFSRINPTLQITARSTPHPSCYVITLNNQPLAQLEQPNFTRTLHLLSLELSACQDLSSLYKRAVELTLSELKIDRMGILLVDSEQNTMQGTWGTNDKGEVIDESDFTAPMPDAPWVEFALASKNYVVTWENKELLQYFKPVGRGWNAMVALWDGDTPFGWIACDNLLNQQPMTEQLKEVIAMWGATLSHLIVRKRSELKLQQVNEELERRVTERTKALVAIQQELIETEKLASLGNLVAGIAHEVNTPLGISITATSHLQEQTNILIAHLNSGKLSKQHLEKYLHNNVEASDVMLRTLKHAADLLKNFKQLAADQSMNEELTTDLKQLLDTVFGTFAYSPAGNANMINQIPANIMLHINAARLSQVFSNLVQNSLVHAFATTQAPQIKVVLEPHDEYYLLHYTDNGSGIAEEHRSRVFEPFFTTKRGNGGTGLGLNIIYNIMTGLRGKIECKPTTAGGVHFLITLPK